MSDTPRYARVQATMGRAGWSRHAAHTAKLGGLTGHGASQAKALEHLGSLITEACGRGDTSRAGGDAVAFKWDAANRQLWIAVPDVLHGGATEYAVDCSGDVPANPHGGGSRAGMARDAWRDAVGMADLPDRPSLPVMPAEVREMLSSASDALTGLGRYAGNLSEAESEAQSALADLADYVSAQFAPSELAR